MQTHDYDSNLDNNPNDTSKTVLQIYCEFKGWQGGTLEQALSDFKNLPMEQKDRFCGLLVDNMGDITDIGRVRDFMHIRASYLTTKHL